MLYANQMNADGSAPLLPAGRILDSRSRGFKAIFFGSNNAGPQGLRAGWRALIFLALFATMFASFAAIRAGGIHGLQANYKNLAHVTVTPLVMIESESAACAFLYIAALIMGKIEHRQFSAYGLPLRRAMGKDFWVGASTGILTISSTLLAMFMLHGFRITGFALHGTAIVTAPLAWAVAFLLAGMTEEFLCRGYIQYTLTSGIGFWPAAFVMSGFFAFSHAFNANETFVGVSTVALFGLLLCLFLRRTGNLWCAVGFHMAYDWGQTLYGVPDSGIVPYHNLFSSAFSGPRWLTGGVVGPEASIVTPIALLVAALCFGWFYPENRYGKSDPAATS